MKLHYPLWPQWLHRNTPLRRERAAHAPDAAAQAQAAALREEVWSDSWLLSSLELREGTQIEWLSLERSTWEHLLAQAPQGALPPAG